MMSNLQLAEMAVHSLSRRDREELIKRLTGPRDAARLISRREFAERAGRSLRWVDMLEKRGAIRKVRVPGSSRAVGFLESDVEELLTGKLTGGAS